MDISSSVLLNGFNFVGLRPTTDYRVEGGHVCAQHLSYIPDTASYEYIIEQCRVRDAAANASPNGPPLELTFSYHVDSHYVLPQQTAYRKLVKSSVFDSCTKRFDVRILPNNVDLLIDPRNPEIHEPKVLRRDCVLKRKQWAAKCIQMTAEGATVDEIKEKNYHQVNYWYQKGDPYINFSVVTPCDSALARKYQEVNTHNIAAKKQKLADDEEWRTKIRSQIADGTFDLSNL
jgi:hypothetical protein